MKIHNITLILPFFLSFFLSLFLLSLSLSLSLFFVWHEHLGPWIISLVWALLLGLGFLNTKKPLGDEFALHKNTILFIHNNFYNYLNRIYLKDTISNNGFLINPSCFGHWPCYPTYQNTIHFVTNYNYVKGKTLRTSLYKCKKLGNQGCILRFEKSYISTSIFPRTYLTLTTRWVDPS
jgi:hypothetical protein